METGIKSEADKIASKDLSIVIPVYNEEENLDILCNDITRAMQKLNLTYEIIFVERGSHDKSFKKLNNLKEKFPNLVVVRLKRRFSKSDSGQSVSLSVGIYLSKGKIVITMDSDLQNDPMDIPIFINKIKENYDIVCGWRRVRQDPFLTKTLPSKFGNRILSILSEVKLHDSCCTFKAFKNYAAKEIAKRLHRGFHRFIPLIGKNLGLKICEIEIHHQPRIFGKSKYGFSRLPEAFLDFFILSFLFSDKNKKILYYLFLIIIIIFNIFFAIMHLFLISIILFLTVIFIFYVINKAKNLPVLDSPFDSKLIENILHYVARPE